MIPPEEIQGRLEALETFVAEWIDGLRDRIRQDEFKRREEQEELVPPID